MSWKHRDAPSRYFQELSPEFFSCVCVVCAEKISFAMLIKIFSWRNLEGVKKNERSFLFETFYLINLKCKSHSWSISVVCCGAKAVLYNVELATKKGKCYCIIFSSDKSERDPGRGGVLGLFPWLTHWSLPFLSQGVKIWLNFCHNLTLKDLNTSCPHLSFWGGSPRPDIPHVHAEFPISWAEGEALVHQGRWSDLGQWPVKHQS